MRIYPEPMNQRVKIFPTELQFTVVYLVFSSFVANCAVYRYMWPWPIVPVQYDRTERVLILLIVLVWPYVDTNDCTSMIVLANLQYGMNLQRELAVWTHHCTWTIWSHRITVPIGGMADSGIYMITTITYMEDLQLLLKFFVLILFIDIFKA